MQPKVSPMLLTDQYHKFQRDSRTNNHIKRMIGISITMISSTKDIREKSKLEIKKEKQSKVEKEILLKKRREQAKRRRLEKTEEQIKRIAKKKKDYDQNRSLNRTLQQIRGDSVKKKKQNEIRKLNRTPEQNKEDAMKKRDRSQIKYLNRTSEEIEQDVRYEKKRHIDASEEVRERKRKYSVSFYAHLTTGEKKNRQEKELARIILKRQKMYRVTIASNVTKSPIQKRIDVIVDGVQFSDSSLPYINIETKGEGQLIFVFDHDQILDGSEYIRYYSTCSTFGTEIVQEAIIAREQSRSFLVNMYGPNLIVTQLHHVGNPHLEGYYKEYEEKKINESTCHHLSHAYRHNKSKILVTTSMNGTELIFFPDIFSTKINLTSILSTEENKKIQDLRYACRSTESLLAFKLNCDYTILKACQIIGNTKSMFHSCVPHLRFATHCCKSCAKIHNFPNKRYKKLYPSSKKVNVYGSVRLVRTLVMKDSAQESFLSIILPLTKMLEYILQNLPEELFENKLSSVKTLYDTACTYISLNMFWGTSTDDRLPKIYYVRKGGTYVPHPIGDNHDGLYLHKDKNNWKFGAVLIFGADIDGFDQRYVTFALRLPCPGWSLVLGDYRNLLHAVSKGNNNNGLRFSLVIANHQSTVKGVNEFGQEVYNEDGIQTVL